MHYHVREYLYAVYKHRCSALRSWKRGQRQSSAGKSTSACIQHITTTSIVIMLLHNSSTITQYRSESLVYLVNSYTRKSSPLNVSKTNTLLGIVVGLHHNSQAPRGRMCTNMGYLIDIIIRGVEINQSECLKEVTCCYCKLRYSNSSYPCAGLITLKSVAKLQKLPVV